MKGSYKKPRKGAKATQARAKAYAKKLTKTQRKQVKQIVKGQAETKETYWYNGATAPIPGGPLDGVANCNGELPNAIAVAQNQFIQSNTTDLLRVLPNVAQGDDDNQRIGQEISPVSCKLSCRVFIAPVAPNGQGFVSGYSYNFKAVAYLLQHTSLKTYKALYASNDFNQLLRTTETTTQSFKGDWYSSQMPVEQGYYKVLKKKTMILRTSGSMSTSPALTISLQGTNNNPTPFYHEWTWDVTKHLPKKLRFPESNATGPGSEDPLNTAPFWCVGYYNMDGTTFGTTPQIFINQQYMTKFKFKDM
ncbi:MAG: capsid protein [Wigfec virus K19_521]|nr:MAG: capsid protein [Wigfec virus K19_521]